MWLCAQHNYKSPYRAGLKAGYSIHTITGDLTRSRHSHNFIGGLWFQLKMNKKWTAQTEILLIDKGIGAGPSGKSPTRVSPHWVRLHYFEFPVLFQYHRKMTYFEFGPGLGYLINLTEHLYGNKSPDLIINYPFNRSELSFNLGMGFTLGDKWSIGLRLSHSVLPIRAAVPSVSKKSYNALLALNISRQIKLKKKKSTEQQD